MEILFVCTGNICRSPMAEGLLRARLESGGVEATVRSAGFLFDDRGAEPGAVAALAKLDIDLSGHVSQKVSAELMAQADLVLVMEHRHLRELVTDHGADLAKVYTLPDLVARAEARASLEGPRREPFPDWVAAIAAGRSTDDVLRADRTLEVPDPMGLSKRAFRKSAAEIGALVDRLVAVAWPEVANAPVGGSPVPAPTAPTEPIETRRP